MKEAVAAVFVVLLTGLAAGCTGDEGAEPVATSSCGRVLYEGGGKPDVVVVSDFPFGGDVAEYTNTRLMVDAIEHVFRQRGFRAGDHRVGYQSCNDTVGIEDFNASLCRRNARAYAATEDVVGMIGPVSSGCAVQQIPILGREAAGPLAIVSPANTWAGLTRNIPDKRSGNALYPDGLRNYARVIPHDRVQGYAAARLAKRLGARRVVLLEQRRVADDYVAGHAGGFIEAAKRLGLQVSRFAWFRRGSYARLAREVAAARPDAVFLAGLTQGNAKRLVEDLRGELGWTTPLIGPDSFANARVAAELGRAGEGLYATEAGILPDRLPAAGKRFLRAFGRPSVEVEQSYAVEAAQATEVLLDAIGRSDGTRASVVDELFATKVESGILGSFTFDRFGDMDPASISLYRIEKGELVPYDVVSPKAQTGP